MKCISFGEIFLQKFARNWHVQMVQPVQVPVPESQVPVLESQVPVLETVLKCSSSTQYYNGADK